MPAGVYARKSLVDRFLGKVNKDGPVHPTLGTACWLWTASTIGKGYGALKRASVTTYAHRLSWEISNGPIPVGMHVLHRCDNMICVRQDHLFIGTNLDNVTDKVKKGRQYRARGELCGMSKLTAADVVLIRTSTENNAAVAAKFGVSPRTIYHVRARTRWGHVA